VIDRRLSRRLMFNEALEEIGRPFVAGEKGGSLSVVVIIASSSSLLSLLES
jgi:hypothetical protein